MLTPDLERLIRQGKAEYKSYAVGGSGVGTIPVPTSKRIVITDFTWHPFSDVDFNSDRFHVAVRPLVQIEFPIPVGGTPFSVLDPVEDTSDAANTGTVFEILPTIKIISSGIVATMGANVGDTIQFLDVTGLIVLLTATITEIVDADTILVDTNGFDAFDAIDTVQVKDVTTDVTVVDPELILNYFIVIVVDAGDWSSTTSFTVVDPYPVVDLTSPFFFGFNPGDLIVNGTSGGGADVLNYVSTGTPGYSPGILNVVNLTGSFSPDDVLFDPDTGTNVIESDAAVLFSIKENVLETIANSIHHLRFRAQSKESVFNFRDTPAPIIADVTEGELTQQVLLGMMFPDPIQIHCYLEFMETVQINIWKFSPSGNTFNMATPLPAQANEPNGPTGYNSNFVVRQILTGQGAVIWPLGTSRDPAAVGARAHDEFYDDIGALTALAQPTNNQSFPLVNIGYVIFNNTEK